MPERVVYKSSAVEWLDRYFAGHDREVLRARYAESLELIESLDGALLSQITASVGPPDPGAAQHFFDHWLADSSELGRKAVDRVMRHAYDQAIRLATRADGVVPIETFWVTGAGDDFEIHLCDGPQRITVFVFIPGVAGGSTSTESRSWVIRVGRDPGAERLDDEDPPVLKVQVSGPEPGASS